MEAPNGGRQRGFRGEKVSLSIRVWKGLIRLPPMGLGDSDPGAAPLGPGGAQALRADRFAARG
jgi:hypothetical protein